MESIGPGQVVKSFDANSDAAPVNGTAFAIQQRADSHGLAKKIRVATRFATAPTSVAIKPQGAFNDVDAEYKDLGADLTNTAGEQAEYEADVRFVRARVSARSGGSGVTVEIKA